jgi:hypothetical protein
MNLRTSASATFHATTKTGRVVACHASCKANPKRIPLTGSLENKKPQTYNTKSLAHKWCRPKVRLNAATTDVLICQLFLNSETQCDKVDLSGAQRGHTSQSRHCCSHRAHHAAFSPSWSRVYLCRLVTTGVLKLSIRLLLF